MRRRLTLHRLPAGHGPSHRLAWWAAFLTTVALIVLLNAVRADAAALSGGGPSLPAIAGLEAEEADEDPVEGEGEEVEEEGECDAEEEAECLEGAAGEGPPRECLLASASATVSVHPRSRRVVLTVHYTAPAATRALISYRLHGAHGGLTMGSERRRLAGTGAFHDTETETPAQMTRVLGARSFSVEIQPLGAPAYCDGYFSQRLTVRHATAHGPVWSE